MLRSSILLLVSGAAIGSFAQTTPTPQITTTTPSAFVYVASNYSGSNNRVAGYTASTNGQLTPIPGSPWANNITWMAVNGKFLFGSDNVANDDYRNIYSYLIEPNGALKYLGATDIQTRGSSNDTCNQGGYLTLDHSGRYLYQFVSDFSCNTLGAFQSWSVNTTSGGLTYLGSTTGDEYLLWPLTISANNAYAYDFGCNFAIADLAGFKKAANGALTRINENYNFPVAPPTNSYWTECLGYATADTTNHLAADVSYPDNRSDHIATYAINITNGNITTSSTYNNTPATAVVNVRWMSMSPSGKILAVGGAKGLQLFDFNPAGQATIRTGLLTTAPIDMVAWDNANHLYAISNADSRLFVFNVSSSGATEAPGSPYFVAHPVTLITQPK